jgi:predicted nucleic acid-binding protein
MKIVVDTNRIIASLVRDSASRKILLSDKFEFLTAGITKSEIEEHKQEIMEKAKVTEEEFNKIFSLLFSKIFVVSDITIQSKMEEAKQIMDKTDPDYTPFIALTLAVENDGIWSNDKHFEQQARIKVWKTEVLFKLLEENYS